MIEPAVEIAELAFRYPGSKEWVLDGLDLVVRAGERVALLGANGSGKTTLLAHLNGLLTPQQGALRVLGHQVGPSSIAELRRRVGLVFQDPDDQLFMSNIGDDVAFGPANLGLRGSELERAVELGLASVGAEYLRDRVGHHLSGGEKRRAALATVLSMEPELLALDEPTSGLDPVGTRELAKLLIGLGTTQLIATHDMAFALETCPRSVVLSGAKVVLDGPTRELLADEALLAVHGLALPFGWRIPQEVQPTEG